MPRRLLTLFGPCLFALTGKASAVPTAPESPSPPGSTPAEASAPAYGSAPAGDPAPANAVPPAEAQVLEVKGRRPEPGPRGRGAQTVSRTEFEERQARSVPEALRAVPGVAIQQTSHGQASPYVRGLTGQRTVLQFDGFRLNHALFRQGPNQYLFTVDPATVERARVVRGSASVLLGSEAIGGAILLSPREPRLESGSDGLGFHPRLELRHATQDRERGGRAEFDVQFGPDTAVLAGLGARTLDLLEAGGPIEGPRGTEPQSPCFEVDGRTLCVDREGVPPPEAGPRRLQHGTGFDELTADARLVHALGGGDRLTAAAYVYRQYDAPRTDLCPPPEATAEECMQYDEQFRTHVYGKGQLSPGLDGLQKLTVGLGFQRYHEKRRLERPLSYTTLIGRDDVDMLEGYLQAETATLTLGTAALRLRTDYGASATREAITSRAWTIFTSSTTGASTVFPQDRGVYLDESGFFQAGVYAQPSLTLYERVTLRGGARVGFARAEAPAEAESASAAVDQSWTMAVFNGGAEWRIFRTLTLLGAVEQGVRPPNLDDLTARQATGRGYQLENPALAPERALTVETGLRFERSRGLIEAWAFRTTIDGAMERRRATCPPGNFECGANRAPLQLVNTDGTAVVEGLEGLIQGRLPHGFAFGAGITYTRGESDNPMRGLADQVADRKRVPLSRIAPLNGNVDVSWHGPRDGLYVGATWWWAALQDELSYGDTIDARIPRGGTPGFDRFDVRAGLRIPDRFALSLVFENATDAAYRVHGSSINGPGRGLVVNVEFMR
ncbi:TonB-dependent receptor [Myxococcota bacterium]|nr:TonB-dependent receptor [Myxococcota bacterium]